MKRLQYDSYGGPEVMRLAEFEPPRPGPDEVLVRVRAAASNALDWKMRNGEMKLITGRSFPRAMGHDFAGVVEAVGAGVTRLKLGDSVLGVARFRQAGAFAEMVTASEKAVVLKPAEGRQAGHRHGRTLSRAELRDVSCAGGRPGRILSPGHETSLRLAGADADVNGRS